MKTGLAADLKVVAAAKSFPQILFPQNIKMSKYLQILHHYSYLRYKGTGCLANIAKHCFKTSPIAAHHETL